jgi:hypothetical protein
VSFANDPLKTFSGTVQPNGYYETTVQVPTDTVVASVQIGWGPMTSVNDLGLSVYDSSGNLRAQSNAVNLPGLTGKTERVVLSLPAAETWRIRVRNTLPLATSQPFSGVVQFNRVNYGRLSDAGSMSTNLRTDESNLRCFSMWPIGNRFRADNA